MLRPARSRSASWPTWSSSTGTSRPRNPAGWGTRRCSSRSSRACRSTTPACSDVTSTDDLAGLDAIGQAELVRRGDLTAVELVEAAIARIERLDPTINAVVTRIFDRARDTARAVASGPLQH